MTSNAASAAEQSSREAEGIIDVFCVRYPANYFGWQIGTVIFRPKYNDWGDVVEHFERCENPPTQPKERSKMFSLEASKKEEFIKKIHDIKKTLPKSGSHHTNIGIISDVWDELVMGKFLSSQQCRQGLKGLKEAGFPTGYFKS